MIMTTCSIIIRTYNEEIHIAKLLDGIKQQTCNSAIKIEVIIVDSGSTDNTVNISKQKGAKIVTIKKEDFSFGRALNIGIQEASGDIIIMASGHTYPLFSNWIEKMIQPFISEKVAVVYGRQVGNEITQFSEHQVFDKWFPPKSNSKQLNPFCNNANCAIRKSLWESLPYDENLTGLEDIDWANKILNHGYYIVYDSEATVVHVHEETYNQIRSRYQREAIALKKILPQVHFNFFDFIRLFIYNLFSDSLIALKKGVLLTKFSEIVFFRFMQFYGTYLGHRMKGEISIELKNKFYYPKRFMLKSQKEDLSKNSDKKIDYSKLINQ